MSNIQVNQSYPKKRKVENEFNKATVNLDLSLPPRKTFDHVTDKELRKKLKNRESAQAARDRKKFKMMQLENQVAALLDRNRLLEIENRELRSRLQLHNKGNNRTWNQNCAPVDSSQLPTSTNSHQIHDNSSWQQRINSQPQFSRQYGSYNYYQGSTNLSQNNTPTPERNHIGPRPAKHGTTQQTYEQPVRYVIDDNDAQTKQNLQSYTIIKQENKKGPGSTFASAQSSPNSDLCAEQWLMLSFKPETEINNESCFNSIPDFNGSNLIGGSESSSEWQSGGLGGQQMNHEISPKLPMNSQSDLPSPYNQDVYYDSTGIESMSSPDTTYSFGSETSPSNANSLCKEIPQNALHNVLQVT